MNEYLNPQHFAGMVMMEEEHPLIERESETGTRNIVIYHTIGPDEIITPLKNNQHISEILENGPIYEFYHFMNQEAKTWDNTYGEVINKIDELGQKQGVFVSTATASDLDNKGH